MQQTYTNAEFNADLRSDLNLQVRHGFITEGERKALWIKLRRGFAPRILFDVGFGVRRAILVKEHETFLWVARVKKDWDTLTYRFQRDTVITHRHLVSPN